MMAAGPPAWHLHVVSVFARVPLAVCVTLSETMLAAALLGPCMVQGDAL